MSASEVKARPMVVAKATKMEGGPPGGSPTPARSQAVPLQMGNGRLPEGGQGVNNMAKMKSIFEAGGQAAQANVVTMARNNAAPVVVQGDTPRPVVFARASLGQNAEEAPASAPPAQPPVPPTNIQEVIIRESGPEGLTRKEAADFAALLEQTIAMSSQALSEGQTCIGVDGSTIENAKDLQTGLERFAAMGNSEERLSLRPSELDLLKSVIECGLNYQTLEKASKGRLIAFVAGGLIIGAVVLLVTSK